MKKKILILMGIFCLGVLQAQVGINTTDPQGVFHVDPDKTAGTGDEVIVANDGKVGIGTITPSTLLDIKTSGTSASPVSGFTLQDGNQTDGYVLVSDATGVATWKDVAPIDAVQIVIPPGSIGVNILQNDPNYYDTGAYIVIPPGRWALNVISLQQGGNSGTRTPVWISSTLADGSTIANNGGPFAAIKSPDIVGTGAVSGVCWSHNFMTSIGTLVVNNTSGVNKTYYYVAGGTSSFGVPVGGGFFSSVGRAWGETNIIAYRIPTNL